MLADMESAWRRWSNDHRQCFVLPVNKQARSTPSTAVNPAATPLDWRVGTEPDLNPSIHTARATLRTLPPSFDYRVPPVCRLIRANGTPFAPRVLHEHYTPVPSISAHRCCRLRSQRILLKTINSCGAVSCRWIRTSPFCIGAFFHARSTQQTRKGIVSFDAARLVIKSILSIALLGELLRDRPRPRPYGGIFDRHRVFE